MKNIVISTVLYFIIGAGIAYLLYGYGDAPYAAWKSIIIVLYAFIGGLVLQRIRKKVRKERTEKQNGPD